MNLFSYEYLVRGHCLNKIQQHKTFIFIVTLYMHIHSYNRNWFDQSVTRNKIIFSMRVLYNTRIVWPYVGHKEAAKSYYAMTKITDL
jgi:hypothetical protein